MSASLVYPNEPRLARIAFVFSTIFWVGLVAGTLGVGALVLGFLGIAYLFARSGFVAYLRGNGVRVSREQIPELHQRVVECCQRLGVKSVPETYVLNANGMLNALATRFLRRHYVVLFSDVIEALADHPDAIDFYIGHELGHIARSHLRWAGYLVPASMLPLLGSAYSRAREYTCDLHGLACCDDPKDAAYGLAALAAGAGGIRQIDLRRFASQSADTGGFWMSYHELTSDYPWLSKRMGRLIAAAGGRPVSFPSRHALAWLVAFFVPRTGVAAGGGAAGMMVAVAMIGILAAIAVPNFLRFQTRAKLGEVRALRRQVQSAGHAYIDKTRTMPPSLEAMGLPEDLSNGVVESVTVDGQSIVLALRKDLQEIGGTHIALTPYIQGGQLLWDCSGDLSKELLPLACSDRPAPATTATAEAPSEPPTPRLTAGEHTCSREFRSSAEYQALGAATQDALREACNAWRLQQLDAQVHGTSR